MGQPFGDCQYEIYLRGVAGEVPAHPIRWDELEARAAEAMSPEANGYVFGGAGAEDTMRENLSDVTLIASTASSFTIEPGSLDTSVLQRCAG